jgi:carboxyl-terminal processing protease
MAGAIKDHGRGTLLGEQTFGKGTVQIPQTLSDGSELRVTIAEWLTPKKQQINGEGIVPDVYVERTQEDFVEGRDPQLDRAVEYLLEHR